MGTGADDYITKPLNLQALELRTANLLQLQQKQKAWLKAQLMNITPQAHLAEITDPFLMALHNKMDDAGLGVEYISKTMTMGRSSLTRKLKSLLDISANDLIRQYQLQKASQLMTSGLDISTAAYQVGLGSPAYVCQCFKEQNFMTPTEYTARQS